MLDLPDIDWLGSRDQKHVNRFTPFAPAYLKGQYLHLHDWLHLPSQEHSVLLVALHILLQWVKLGTSRWQLHFKNKPTPTLSEHTPSQASSVLSRRLWSKTVTVTVFSHTRATCLPSNQFWKFNNKQTICSYHFIETVLLFQWESDKKTLLL